MGDFFDGQPTGGVSVLKLIIEGEVGVGGRGMVGGGPGARGVGLMVRLLMWPRPRQTGAFELDEVDPAVTTTGLTDLRTDESVVRPFSCDSFRS